MNTTENSKLNNLFTRVQKAKASIATAEEKHFKALNALHEFAKENDCHTFTDAEGNCWQTRSKKGQAYVCAFKVDPAVARANRAAAKLRQSKIEAAEQVIATLPESMQEAAREEYLKSLESAPVEVVTEDEVAPEATTKSRKRKTGTDNEDIEVA